MTATKQITKMDLEHSRKHFAMVQHDFEILSLCKFIVDKGLKSFIEIGTHKGGTFYLFSTLCEGLKISVDWNEGNFGGIGKEAAEKRNTLITEQFPDATFIEGDSKKLMTWNELEKGLNGQKVDFLFIDGDHSFEGVKSDFENYRGFVREGGFIAFHDVLDCPFHRNFKPVACMVSELWNLLDGNKTEFITENGGWGGIGIIRNDENLKLREA